MSGSFRFPMPKPPAGEPSRPRPSFSKGTEIAGIQRRMAFIIQKREEIYIGLKKILPVDSEKFPEIDREYKELYDAFDRLICAEARSLIDLQ